MTSTFDVLGLGAVAVDDLIYVDAFPPPDAKVRFERTDRQCGGLTATALVAASRLGSRSAYAGVLGTDALSAFALASLEREKVDITQVRRDPLVQPVHSFIVVGEHGHTRNVFAHSRHFTGPPEDWPPEPVIRSAKVLLIDHFGLSGMIRAARIARESGIPVVADAERDSGPRFGEWLATADHLILSARFAQALARAPTPSAAAQGLWSAGRQLVAVTDGRNGCWFTEDGEAVRHQPAFPVAVVDTTGCGDVFHGAYASVLARGLPGAERIRFASAAAALKATAPGGQTGIPTRDVVEKAMVDLPAMA